MTELDARVDRIELSTGLNVYAIAGEHGVSLIGAGSSATARELVSALRDRGFAPSDVARIVANSWSPGCLGGAREFPRADLFVYSPDMTSPRDWEAWLQTSRRLRRDVALELVERGSWSQEDVTDWLDTDYPRGTSQLNFIPIRAGQRLVLGELELDVIDAQGFGGGCCVLHNAEASIAFVGPLELDGLPVLHGDVREYLMAVDRVTQLSPEWLLGLRGVPTGHGRWTLKRISRFLGNYLSNASSMLLEGRALIDIATADLGHSPESAKDHVEAVLRHRPFLEELVRSGVLGASGDGISRRYSAL